MKPDKRSLPLWVLWVTLGVAALGALAWWALLTPWAGEGSGRIRIPAGATLESVADSLASALGPTAGKRVYNLWRMQGGDAATAHGYYAVEPGTSLLRVSRRLLHGGPAQTPVTLTYNNLRLMSQLAERVGATLECSPQEFMDAADSLLRSQGVRPEEFPAYFLPDSYLFYWTDSPERVARTLVSWHDRFWSPERIAKARALGLRPEEVATIASIVEEETQKRDERPLVARLYLNRLAQGMKLQADPTVKYATGDFTLRRITADHLRTQSPYNTYLHPGLPPGPIRLPEGATIDAVLDAPGHPYIYMCAREDFSGYHNFATDYATHRANAARYRAALESRGIR